MAIPERNPPKTRHARSGLLLQNCRHVLPISRPLLPLRLVGVATRRLAVLVTHQLLQNVFRVAVDIGVREAEPGPVEGAGELDLGRFLQVREVRPQQPFAVGPTAAKAERLARNACQRRRDARAVTAPTSVSRTVVGSGTARRPSTRSA